MGVYVPTRFPRNCRDCSELCLADVMECYPDEYGEDSDGNKIVCPLIEIVQCKDCKYFITPYENIIDADGLCDNMQVLMDKADFCSHGERPNADQHTQRVESVADFTTLDKY